MSGNLVLCGPIVRRVDRSSVSIFVATRRACTVTLTVYANDRGEVDHHDQRMEGARKTIQLGAAGGAHAVVVTAAATDALVWGGSYYYDLSFDDGSGATKQLHDDGVLVAKFANATPMDLLIYKEGRLPGFLLPPADHARLRILHGSCRKPHGSGRHDALAHADTLIKDALDDATQTVVRPQQLFLTGDQIYADDVDPALLGAINAFAGHAIGRGELTTDLGHLGHTFERQERIDAVTSAAFTTGARSTQLILLGEFYAMHLFAWSPEPWPQDPGGGAWKDIKDFFDRLLPVRRALANIATYMIFDDHEITDDWNLRADWADDVLARPMGRRILRNGLAAYAVCQHWGNDPAAFARGTPGGRLLERLDGWDGTVAGAGEIDDILPVPANAAAMSAPAAGCITWSWRWRGAGHEVFGLDTRTRRRFGPGDDMSLMTEREIDAVLGDGPAPPVTFVLSATPVLGVRVIEWAQKTLGRWLGSWKLDDEPWVKGRARAHLVKRLLDRAPVIVLSGDVHFAFGTSLFDRAQPRTRIVNFVSSALKNQPPKLADHGFWVLNIGSDEELQSAAAMMAGGAPLVVETRSVEVLDGRVLEEQVLIGGREEAEPPAAGGSVVMAGAATGDGPELILQSAENKDRTDITGALNLGDLHFEPDRHEVVHTLWRFGGDWRFERQVARLWLRERTP